MKNRIIQAYKQAPWRVQLQWIGLFLLALVLVATITGLYLNISAQAATAGRNIQSLERKISNINNQIAQATTDLAKASSSKSMLARADELGFRQLNPQEAVYLQIPGYRPNRELTLALPRDITLPEGPILRSSYQTTIWGWLMEQLSQPATSPSPQEGEVLP